MQESYHCLYGINPVFELIRGGRRPVRQIWLNEGGKANPRLRKLAQFAAERQVPLEWCDKMKLFELSGTREHQGAVADAAPFPYTPFSEMLEAPRLVLLDSIEDPHNVGAIMRTAEVLGWKNILLPRRNSPMVLPSVAKAAAGACEHLNIAVNCSANQYVKIAKEAGYVIVSLDGAGKSSLEAVRETQPEKLLLVVGGEDSGVSQFILMNSDHVAAIPQRGKVNSLNASVAAALALYLLKAQDV
jgi:23S rRNA (guanosine2251-2'-O)-methyltransferase